MIVAEPGLCTEFGPVSVGRIIGCVVVVDVVDDVVEVVDDVAPEFDNGVVVVVVGVVVVVVVDAIATSILMTNVSEPAALVAVTV